MPNTHAFGVRFQLFHLTQSNLMLQKFPKPKDKCHIFSHKLPYSLQLSLTIEKKIFMSCSSLQSNRSKFTGNYTRLSGASQCRLDGSILWIIKRKQILSSCSAESSFDSRLEDHKRWTSNLNKSKKKSYKCKHQELWEAEVSIGPGNQNKQALFRIPCKKKRN